MTALGTALLPSCTCQDREAQAVAAMVARGWDQIQASRVVYSDGPTFGSSPEVWRAWIGVVVADLTAPLRARWGL